MKHTIRDGAIRPDPRYDSPSTNLVGTIAKLRWQIDDAREEMMAKDTLLASYARVIRRRRAIGAAMVLAAFAGAFAAVFLIWGMGW